MSYWFSALIYHFSWQVLSIVKDSCKSYIVVFTLEKNEMVWSHTRLSGPRREKTCLRGFANNTGADQPAHPRRLISAFVIRFLESIICKLGAGEISIF